MAKFKKPKEAYEEAPRRIKEAAESGVEDKEERDLWKP